MELVIHGVPQGHKIWGGTPDRYYESFYGNNEIYKDANPVMVVEIRKSENVFCSYYTIIRYKKVNAENGRSGSYFGLTFKVNGKYCTDVYTLYDLMTQIYNKYIFNVVLAKEGVSEKYLINDFALVDGSCKEAVNVFMGNIKSHFSADFEDINPRLQKNNISQVLYYNLEDINSETFFKDTMNFGKVLISPEYPTKDMVIESVKMQIRKGQDSIKEFQSSIDQLTEQNQVIPTQKQKIKVLEKELADAQDISKKYKNELIQEKNRIIQLEQDIKGLKKELTSYKSSVEVKQLVSGIEKPIYELAEILKGFHVGENKDVDNKSDSNKEITKKKFNIKLFGLAFFIFIVLIGFFIVSLVGGNNKNILINDEITEKETKISELTIANELLTGDLKKLQLENAQVKEVVESIFKDAKIDLKEYNKGTINKGDKFTLSLKNAPNIDGLWDVEGFTIEDTSKTNTSILAAEKGQAVVSYYVCGVKVASREFEVK